MTARKHLSEYRTWYGMIRRCTNPKDSAWKYYGGREISVCDSWRNSFAAFLADIGTKPYSNFSIDRIDNDGNYEPGNCRWVTPMKQATTRRRVPRACWCCGKIYAAFGRQKFCSTICRDKIVNRRARTEYYRKKISGD
jgi:hypothetical protein